MLWVAKRLVLAVMLVHSVFGCCWHHTHTCACAHETQVCSGSDHGTAAQTYPDGCSHQEMNRRVAHRCTHHHDHASHTPHEQSPTGNDQEPGPHRHQCEHGNCTFVVESGRIALSDLDLIQAFVVDYDCLLRPMDTQAFHENLEFSTLPRTAALRCAVLQVWQI